MLRLGEVRVWTWQRAWPGSNQQHRLAPKEMDMSLAWTLRKLRHSFVSMLSAIRRSALRLYTGDNDNAGRCLHSFS